MHLWMPDIIRIMGATRALHPIGEAANLLVFDLFCDALLFALSSAHSLVLLAFPCFLLSLPVSCPIFGSDLGYFGRFGGVWWVVVCGWGISIRARAYNDLSILLLDPQNRTAYW